MEEIADVFTCLSMHYRGPISQIGDVAYIALIGTSLRLFRFGDECQDDHGTVESIFSTLQRLSTWEVNRTLQWSLKVEASKLIAITDQ